MTPVHDLVILKRLKILLKPSKSPYILQVSWCLHTGFCIKVNGRCCQLMPRFVRWGRYVQNLSWFIKGCFTILLSTIISSEAELLAVMHAIDKIWPDIHYGLNVTLFRWYLCCIAYLQMFLGASDSIIQLLIVYFQIQFKVTYIYREGNLVVDIILKLGVHLDFDRW